jgi:hypothetical protein
MFYCRTLFVALVSFAALATPSTKEGIPGPALALNNATSTLEFSHFADLQSGSCPTSCVTGSDEYLLSITFG